MVNRKVLILRLRQWIRIAVRFVFNPRLILCFFLAWMITNGWSYVALGLGIWLDILWLKVLSGVYLGFLWVPFTPEKIVTLIIAIFFLRLLFPKDEQTLGVLTGLYRKTIASKKSPGKEKKRENGRGIDEQEKDRL